MTALDRLPVPPTPMTVTEIDVSTVEYLTDEEVCARIPGLTPTTLKRYSGQGEGPTFTVIARRRVYEWTDVVAWMRASRQTRTDRFGEH